MFSPDGQWLATMDRTTARVWKVQSQDHWVFRVEGEEFTAFALSPVRRELVTGARDGTLRLWDSDLGKSRVLGSEEGPVLALAFSPDGHHVASAGRGEL